VFFLSFWIFLFFDTDYAFSVSKKSCNFAFGKRGKIRNPKIVENKFINKLLQ